MAEIVDNVARDRIAKLYTEIREHAADYWGPDKQNGKRSEVVGLTSRVNEMETKIKHYEDTREQSCLGLAAFREFLNSQKKDDVTVKQEKIKANSLMAIQWIQVIGLVLVALISIMKK